MRKTNKSMKPIYSFRQMVELSACTNCRLCSDVCPAVNAGRDGTLSPLYRMKGLRQLLRDNVGLFKRLLPNPLRTPEAQKAFSDTVFQCTLCGNCREVCTAGIQLTDLWKDMRQDMVRRGKYPKKIDLIKDNLLKSYNVFDEDNEERAEWVEDMRDPPDDGFIRDRAEVVYFTGCVSSYFPVAQKIAIAQSAIFTKANVDFTLLGEDEWCCGFPFLGAGLEDLFTRFMEHNIEAIKARGAGQVVFSCPSCYQMWREFYPEDTGIAIAHSTEYALKLIQEGLLPLSPIDMKVTYHDPCDLGRGARVFDAPRQIINAIPGVRFVELPNNRENCKCCGGGGNLEMINAKLSENIARNKIEEVMQTGADAIVTSCQQCVRSMLTYVRRNKIKIEVLDINQLIEKAIGD